MMENLRSEEEKMIKYRNLFRLKKELNYTAIRDVRNLYRQEKETKAILRDIKNLFEHEEENCYEPVRVNNFWSNNYIEYESNAYCLNKIRPYLKDIINSLKKSDTWTIQLTIANLFLP